MTLAPGSDTAFARAMDDSIDKDEFWQIPCATGPAAAGTYTEDPRSPSDFFDEYVVMNEVDPGSLGANFFMPLQGGQGEDDFSPPTSSVTEAITSASSTNGSAADVSRTTSNFSVEETLKAIPLAETTHYQPLRGRLLERASGTDSETTHHVVLNPDAVEQKRRLLSGRRGQEQAAGGSITDSELLQLEGLSVNSPRKLGPRQTSGPSVPTTTAHDIAGITADIDLDQLAQNTRNHKPRWLETINSNLKRAVGGLVRGPQQQQQQQQQQQHQQQHQQQQPPPPQQQQQQHPSTAPIPQTMTPSHVESAKKATRRLASESQAAPFTWDSFPISPPLTDLNNPQPSDAATFGNGCLDDPFYIDPAASFTHTAGLAPAAQIIGMGNVQNCNNLNTPSHTPDMETDHAMDDELTKLFTTSPTWNLDNSFGLTTDMDTLFGPVSADGISMDTCGFDPSSDDGHTSTRNHHNLTIQVPTYVQDNRHHHAPLSDDFATSGLMIHMPLPRTPATAPLLSSSVPPMHHPQPPQQQQQHMPQYAFPEQTTPQHNMHSFRGPYTDHGHYGGTQRRSKPRAPSSGARYHQMGPAGPASISPRKTRQPSCSSSSPSPTPGGRRSRSAGRRPSLTHRASASDITTTNTQTHAVRKRSSMPSSRGQKRTTSTSSSADGSGGGGGGGVGGGGGGGFVNYTPNDHGVLMTGVAPSGSSKTKARREKEAMERQRKLSEAMVKTMAEAGVDVDRLKQEGIVI
ncbi:hypothetical protein N8I77_002361 [Diaporthe amygdali]|uniref:Developmental regulatory protein wetA n=1 Tax=Phomopsis amygdali TaxID=1214568 RepID=A0AAD9W910_PHOAM|nr:hypothetical protein N8I77_002361 [Diaporthe amygdali]